MSLGWRLLLPFVFAVGAGAACTAPGADGLDDELGDEEFLDGKADATGTATVGHTKLAIDLRNLAGKATLELDTPGSVALETSGLTIDAVRDRRGNRKHRVVDGTLRISRVSPPLEIEYHFTTHDQADGLLAGGSTVVWPYFCGNVFPCHSAPSDGTTFELALAGVPTGSRAIYPTAIDAEAPAYMMAWAVGAYDSKILGTTTAGTEVAVHWLPGGKTAALQGTKHLAAVFDWFEKTLGDYSFGKRVASVAVVWGEGAYGGMEHHPFWHVATDAMSDEETHAHEAAHGWFGDGVRLRCWEDFVLSEGTVTYLAARALGQTAGASKEAEVWRDYQSRLRAAEKDVALPAWPTGCGKVDILKDGLFSEIPYLRGAFFYKAVADAVGVEALDGVLHRFYVKHVGRAAGMADMIAAIEHDTGFDTSALVQKWLRQK